MTKSAIATPGFWLGHVKTVKIEGSWRGTKISIENIHGRNDWIIHWTAKMKSREAKILAVMNAISAVTNRSLKNSGLQRSLEPETVTVTAWGHGLKSRWSAEFFRPFYVTAKITSITARIIAPYHENVKLALDFHADFHVVRGNYSSLFQRWNFSGQLRFPLAVLNFSASCNQLLELRS